MPQLELLTGGDDGDDSRLPVARGPRGTRMLSVRDLFARFPEHRLIPAGARRRVIGGVSFITFRIVVDWSGATKAVHVLLPTTQELSFGLQLVQSATPPSSPVFDACDVARWGFMRASSALDPLRNKRMLRAVKAYLAGEPGGVIEPDIGDPRFKGQLVPILNHAVRYYLRPKQLGKLSARERSVRRELARSHLAHMLSATFPLAPSYPTARELDAVLELASRSLSKERNASLYKAVRGLASKMGMGTVSAETIRTSPTTPKITEWDRKVGLVVKNRGKNTTDARHRSRAHSQHATGNQQQEPSPRTKPLASPRARSRSSR